ncbi:MAG: hypothetical protein ABSB22_02675, partial [Thermodesulfobacteriota bacterium]
IKKSSFEFDPNLTYYFVTFFSDLNVGVLWKDGEVLAPRRCMALILEDQGTRCLRRRGFSGE